MPATYRSPATALLTALVAAIALSACGTSSPKPAPTVTVTSSAAASSSASDAAATPPAMVGVTTAGALVALNPSTGVVTQTLVPSHVLGDEVSVSSTGLVYFAVQRGCTDEIEAIPVAGGSVIDIATGSLPAVSPDGTKLAYTDEPSLTAGCPVNASSNIVAFFHLDIRTLSSGSTIKLAMLAASQSSGLPYPISHLSWAPDNDHLAVSISAPEDNEGWNLNIVDTSRARYYLAGTGVTSVPATGSPTPQLSYLREGVYMPNGDLFVSRACCAGDEPVRNTSRLMWEVTTAGTLVHQVAVGYVTLDHTSLDVSSDGGWLLYLAGDSLYVSAGGATPRELTTGLIAVAWA